ncbi:MAG: DUF1572 family protein [Flavobacteriales bacterium]|jgi:uncharacterized damage-inducible protein DinB|nr:DUF1572 family protein [Flavobacteriales bacterium]MBT3963882.1 DUF1572 family protein [Flavobacteriales bacterium]MBT4706210.1 DUF1572 family protein [Flavobacteriales bacterium]MBT4931395.1 DUF1572 family protein [Flavobacteriales bacterium]MBT5133171.1 DUF1572 family protein [Flavobacteriales bacterium]
MSDQLILGDLITLIQRDLSRLKRELELFNDEANIWKNTEGVTNSAGSLTLHICGNLDHFIGSVVGSTGYVRDREAEFNDHSKSRVDLYLTIQDTGEMVEAILSAKAEEELAAVYPIEVFNSQMTLRFFFQHLYGHLNYHLGQVNYLRRILEP